MADTTKTATLTIDGKSFDLPVLKSSVGPDVVDSFYVLDSEGNKITDPEHVAEIERALVYAMAPPEVGH